MNVLVTGTSGFIGSRLIPQLVEQGHTVYALVRDMKKVPEFLRNFPNINYIIGDLLKYESLNDIPADIDAAYYLVHSMRDGHSNFISLEEFCITNFLNCLKNRTRVKQVIYLSGLISEEAMSSHFASRRRVEEAIINSGLNYTILKSGIIIGAGGASYEILRELVEKLPVMITPNWLRQNCQPIAIHDAIFYLTGVLDNPQCQNKAFDIAGPDTLTYKDMLLQYAKLRRLQRLIITLPVLTPRLSALWLVFVTSVPYRLSAALIQSVVHHAVRSETSIDKIFDHKPMGYIASLKETLSNINEHHITYRDCSSKKERYPLSPPEFGCKKICSHAAIQENHKIAPIENIKQQNLCSKKWKPLFENKNHYLLYKKVRFMGDAWHEWSVTEGGNNLSLNTVFRPQGVHGRLYWALTYPFHRMKYKKLAKKAA